VNRLHGKAREPMRATNRAPQGARVRHAHASHALACSWVDVFALPTAASDGFPTESNRSSRASGGQNWVFHDSCTYRFKTSGESRRTLGKAACGRFDSGRDQWADSGNEADGFLG